MPTPEPTADRAALARDLSAAVDGEVGFDAGSRALYTVDASIYRQVPVGVVWPASKDDVVGAVEVCRRHGVPLLSRGGGTSLAGQGCNAAVVLDFSRHMDRVLEVDPERRLARVQPGCVLDVLRAAAEEHGLTFGPDPATHASCTLGGMLGNNACGIHSVMAGRTSDNVRSLEVLTYGGERLRVGATPEAELREIVAAGGRRGEIYAALAHLRDRHAELVRDRFPDVPRRVSGFNLDELLPENGFHVARALVGSEGTCVTILEAELELVPSPPSRALVTVAFDSLPDAADHVPELMELDLIGCEALDLGLLAGADPELLPETGNGSDGGWMILELGADDGDAVAEKARRSAQRLAALPAARDVRVFTGEEERRRIWKLRESGIAATKRTPSGADVWPGWEDSAVPPERLGDYLRDLRRLMDGHGLEGAFYGHFGQGCVHLRLTFDLASEEGLTTYRRFAHRAAELVTRHGGSLSGEHGDGQARGELLPVMYGGELTRAFGEFKAIWDPAGRMNPGKVVDPYPLDTNLRLGPDHDPWEPETAFAYPDDGGSFARAAGRCVGVGRCRSLEGGTMCPSYRATGEERHSTRGRAHLLFEMLEGGVGGVGGVGGGGGLDLGGWESAAVKEALDLCLACKACRSECPVKVDMATYKAEFLHHHYQARRRPRTAYTFGRIHDWARLASLAPRLVNAAIHLPGLAALAKKVAGVAPERDVPRFADSTFRRRFTRRRKEEEPSGGRPVTLFVDTFTDHFHPEIGEAAVAALESLGYRVEIPDGDLCCGRPLYDYGFLPRAKRLLRTAVDALHPAVERGTPVVGLEPSCTAAFRDELVNFFPDAPAARAVSANFFTLGELLRRDGGEVELPGLDGRAVVHGHCHHDAVMGLDPEVELLAGLGLDLDVLDAGCCGMAGSFGFEPDKYDVSMTCGERVLLPAVRAAADSTLVVADGFSCREQIRQATGRRALHTAEVLARAK